jgi:hypothetical protein
MRCYWANRNVRVEIISNDSETVSYLQNHINPLMMETEAVSETLNTNFTLKTLLLTVGLNASMYLTLRRWVISSSCTNGDYLVSLDTNLAIFELWGEGRMYKSHWRPRHLKTGINRSIRQCSEWHLSCKQNPSRLELLMPKKLRLWTYRLVRKHVQNYNTRTYVPQPLEAILILYCFGLWLQQHSNKEREIDHTLQKDISILGHV